MDLFAHNGASHSGSAEAITHSGGQIVFYFLLAGAIAGTFIAFMLFVLRKFAVIELPATKKEGKNGNDL